MRPRHPQRFAGCPQALQESHALTASSQADAKSQGTASQQESVSDPSHWPADAGRTDEPRTPMTAMATQTNDFIFPIHGFEHVSRALSPHRCYRHGGFRVWDFVLWAVSPTNPYKMPPQRCAASHNRQCFDIFAHRLIRMIVISYASHQQAWFGSRQKTGELLMTPINAHKRYTRISVHSRFAPLRLSDSTDPAYLLSNFMTGSTFSDFSLSHWTTRPRRTTLGVSLGFS